MSRTGDGVSREPITVIGLGAEGAASLGAQAVRAIEGAGLLIGGRRHLEFFPDHAAERWIVGADVPALLDRLEARWAGPDAAKCVVLASGDPCCFGIGPIVAERFGRDRVRQIPAVGSVPLLFNRIGEGWQDVRILSAHGRPLGLVVAESAPAQRVAILTDDENSPARIAEALLAAGVEGSARAVVGEWLGGWGETITEASLGDLPGRTFDRLNVLAVLRDPLPPPEVGIGRPDDAYAHRAGQITKAEVRAVSLGLLRLHRADRVWDVGAGCGSLAIEAAGLVDRGQVWAVEADPAQLELLQENRRRFRAGNLFPVAGCAPEALGDLPDPDAVFVGGSGGRLPAILATCRDRVAPGGRVVANFALLEHLLAAQAFWTRHGWPWELTQLSVARGRAIAGGTRLAALNPVFLLAATRPERD